MSNFNKKATRRPVTVRAINAHPALKSDRPTVNRAGGLAYKVNDKFEFVSILLSSFVQSQCYRTKNEVVSDLKKALSKVDPVFAAKAALYARDEFNMRSSSHLVAAELAKKEVSFNGIRNFFDKIVVRPDDMAEIISLVTNGEGETSKALRLRSNSKAYLPNALKKGFKKAFDRFNGYQLAKYRLEDKDWSLVDIVNMVRPVPTEKNAEALRALVNGELRNSSTWETLLSEAGKNATDEEDLTALKADAWKQLLVENKLGYMALLRNLRNILSTKDDSIIDLACKALKNYDALSHSRILPFRVYTAYREVSSSGSVARHANKVLSALSDAMDLLFYDAPKFENTLVCVDVSGSMSTNVGGMKSTVSCQEIAALFAAGLVSSSKADVMIFSTTAQYVQLNPKDSILTNASKIRGVGGTDFCSIFRALNGAGNPKYDRIIILSDEQGYCGNPKRSFNDYCVKSGLRSKMYSIDLAGYGSMQFPEADTFLMAGFSEKIFDIMKLVEVDKQALIHEIERIEL